MQATPRQDRIYGAKSSEHTAVLKGTQAAATLLSSASGTFRRENGGS